MPTIHVITREGEQLAVEGKTGHSVMETLRDGGVDEILALCGGCCSCATCHVHVDPEWIDQVGLAGADEDDLLDTSDYRTATSRLACQIRIEDALDGLTVTIAPES